MVGFLYEVWSGVEVNRVICNLRELFFAFYTRHFRVLSQAQTSSTGATYDISAGLMIRN